MSSFFIFLLFSIMTNFHPQLSEISLSSIDKEDSTYCLRPRCDTEVEQQLSESIQHIGLLHPPLVQRRGTGHIILSGKKRILAAKELGWSRIPCLICKEDTPVLLKWNILLCHAIIGSQLSCIEQATFFAKAGHDLNDSELPALLPILGHKQNPQLLNIFFRSLTLAPAAIDALHLGYIQPKSIDLLAKCTDRDQEILVRLIDDFQLGGSKQRNLILLALDLTRRLNRSLEEIIGEWERKRTNKDTENKPQQAADLLNWLAEKQSPRHHRAEQEFKSFVREMQIPEFCTLSPTSSFEDDQLTLKIRFSDRDHFRRVWETIRPDLENNRE